jgi:uncharacterized protein
MAQPQKIQISIEEKEQHLRSLMRELEKVLVAFSGGVDSSYLALIANQELKENALCVMGISPSVAEKEREMAKEIAEKFRLNFQIVETEELSNPNYQANPTNRCYFCKTELYGKLKTIAENRTILDGSNTDDLGDYRPGREAAKENGVRSLLIEVGLSKAEIRELSKKHRLPTWDKPASPCLSSRIAYGISVSIERLTKVERGEKFLRELGFREFRVRLHDEIVRLEISPNEMEKVLNKNLIDSIAEKFRKIGFRYVTLDLQGFRSGAMNEMIDKKS